MIDDRGRLFGRVNLFDGLVAAVLLLLIPLGYATYLLFKPAMPRIESVTEAALTSAEERIAIGGNLLAKFKVKGVGFTPLLRAKIGGADALAFVFESPISADVLVGAVPPGPHDLVLFDGVQEVARAAGAITIKPQVPATATLRAVGWIASNDKDAVAALKPGTRLRQGEPEVQIVAVGPVVPGFRRLSIAGSVVYYPQPAGGARRAVVLLGCNDELVENLCAFGMRLENRTPPVEFNLPGHFRFAIDELLPSSPPAKATIRMKLAPGVPNSTRAGDRDDLLDERAAVVTAVNGDTIALDAGVDREPKGWSYRGQRLVPGAPFTLATDRYEISGTILSLDVQAPRP